MLEMQRAHVVFLAFVAAVSCKRESSDATGDGALIAASSDPDAAPLPSMSAVAPPRSASAEHTRAWAHAAPPGSAASPVSSSLARLGDITDPPSKEEGPSITFAPPRVTGGLLTDVEPALRRMRAGVRACYQRFLDEENEPPEASELSLHVLVMQNGSVRTARAQEVSRLSASAVDCMLRRAQVATFPPPVGEDAEVIVAIHLHP